MYSAKKSASDTKKNKDKKNKDGRDMIKTPP